MLEKHWEDKAGTKSILPATEKWKKNRKHTRWQKIELYIYNLQN